MSYYRFFEEFRDGRMEDSAGNVIAVELRAPFIKEGGICYKAVCANPEAEAPNSPVSTTFFNAEYLGSRCRHITEDRARRVHPRLFEYLDRLA